MRRSDFRQIEWNKANEHAQTESMKQTDSDEHPNGHGARDQRSSNQRGYGGDGEGFLSSDDINKPSLSERPDC